LNWEARHLDESNEVPFSQMTDWARDMLDWENPKQRATVLCVEKVVMGPGVMVNPREMV